MLSTRQSYKKELSSSIAETLHSEHHQTLLTCLPKTEMTRSAMLAVSQMIILPGSLELTSSRSSSASSFILCQPAAILALISALVASGLAVAAAEVVTVIM